METSAHPIEQEGQEEESDFGGFTSESDSDEGGQQEDHKVRLQIAGPTLIHYFLKSADELKRATGQLRNAKSIIVEQKRQLKKAKKEVEAYKEETAKLKKRFLKADKKIRMLQKELESVKTKLAALKNPTTMETVGFQKTNESEDAGKVSTKPIEHTGATESGSGMVSVETDLETEK